MGMIVELFGPPAVGKTTFAHALSSALAAKSVEVRLLTSARPVEKDRRQHSGPRLFRPLVRRISAPLRRAGKAVGIVPLLVGADSRDAAGRRLLAMLPPAGSFNMLRYRRYLCLLARSWSQAQSEDAVTIVDQGYHQAVCSLAVLSSRVEQQQIAAVLRAIPMPDLLIHVKAPSELIEARLRNRLRRQGAIERLFEHGLEANLRHIGATESVNDALVRSGSTVICADVSDSVQLEAAVNSIAQRICHFVMQAELTSKFASLPREPLVQRSHDSATGRSDLVRSAGR